MTTPSRTPQPAQRHPVTPRKPRPGRPPAVAKRRILLVDDHPLTRAGLAANLNRQPDLEVCGEADSPAAAMSLLPKVKPDLMVADLTMPGRSGLEFLKDVHAMMPELPIVVLSMHDEALYAERTLRVGARGYLMKDVGVAKVLEAIRLVLTGEVYVSPQVSARLFSALTGRRPSTSTSPIARLSDREFEVFRLLGSGKSTREAAAALHLSPKTVDVHRGSIKVKLQLKDASGLLRYAVRWVETQAVRAS